MKIILKILLYFIVISIGTLGVYIYFMPGLHWYTIVGFLMALVIFIPSWEYWADYIDKKFKK